MELSTIVEGQTIGTVHIMEGTCSRLRFFVRNMNTDMCTYTYTYISMYTYIHKNTCTKTSAITRLSGWLCGWVVWCVVVVVVVVVCCCRGVLVLGILNLEIGKIQGFLSVNL